MKIYHSTDFKLPLPSHHRFPMDKYRLLKEAVAFELGEDLIYQAPQLSNQELSLAHNLDYLEGVIAGTLPSKELRRIGFPWSPAMIERSRRSAGATWAACLSALESGRGVNLAGGTHHAYRSQGGGYCVFNDSAVALKLLESRQMIRRGLVIDLDVHQGDGTADILSPDPAHFCFSMHGEKNYPFRKQVSDLDWPCRDGMQDDEYLLHLQRLLPTIFEQSRPDLVIYLSGADPYEHDRLGRLSLTPVGLAARDALVFEQCDSFGVPVALTMGGGYAENLDEIAQIHLNSVLISAGLPPQF